MAQRFTVSTNYLSAAANMPDANSDYTTMAWIRIVSSPSGTIAFVWRHRHAGGGANDDVIKWQDFGFGLSLRAEFSTAGTTATLISSGKSDNTWYHVATVRDGTTVRLYVDGTLADDDTNDNSSRGEASAFDVCLLDDGGQANEIDVEGLKFFSRALTAEQIAVEMKRTMPIGPDALNAWPFINASNGRDFRGACPLTLTGTLGASEPVGVQFRASSTDAMAWLPVAGGTTSTIEVPSATLTLDEQVPTLLFSAPVPNATLTLEEQAPTLRFDTPVPNATLTLTGQVPALSEGTVLEVPSATLTLTGQVPTLFESAVIAVPNATLTLEEQVPTLAFSAEIPSATLTLTGQVPTLSAGTPQIEVPAATLTLTAFAPIPMSSVPNPVRTYGPWLVGGVPGEVVLELGDEFYLVVSGPSADAPKLRITVPYS